MESGGEQVDYPQLLEQIKLELADMPCNIPDYDSEGEGDFNRYIWEHGIQIFEYATRWLLKVMETASGVEDFGEFREKVLEPLLKQGTMRQIAEPLGEGAVKRAWLSIPDSIKSFSYGGHHYIRGTGKFKHERAQRDLSVFETNHHYKVYISPDIKNIPVFIERLYEILDASEVSMQSGKVVEDSSADGRQQKHNLLVLYVRKAKDLTEVIKAAEKALAETETEAFSFGRDEYPLGTFAAGGKVIVGRDYSFHNVDTPDGDDAHSFDGTIMRMCAEACKEFFDVGLVHEGMGEQKKLAWLKMFLHKAIMSNTEKRKSGHDFLHVDVHSAVVPRGVQAWRLFGVINEFLTELEPIQAVVSGVEEREAINDVIAHRIQAALAVADELVNIIPEQFEVPIDRIADSLVGKMTEHEARKQATAEFFVQQSLFREMGEKFELKLLRDGFAADSKGGAVVITYNGSIVIVSPPDEDSGLRTVDYIPMPSRAEVEENLPQSDISYTDATISSITRGRQLSWKSPVGTGNSSAIQEILYFGGEEPSRSKVISRHIRLVTESVTVVINRGDT